MLSELPGKLREVELHIHEAFADSPYPGDDNLIRPDDAWDTEGIDDILRGSRWDEVALWFIFYGPTLAFWLLTDEAQRHYLPLWMVISLYAEAEGTGGATDTALTYLAPPPHSPRRRSNEEFRQFMASFTPRQVAVVREFIRLFVDDFSNGFDSVLASVSRAWLGDDRHQSASGK